jgi:hypothetical protein
LSAFSSRKIEGTASLIQLFEKGNCQFQDLYTELEHVETKGQQQSETKIESKIIQEFFSMNIPPFF